jgi:hypothetical protein
LATSPKRTSAPPRHIAGPSAAVACKGGEPSCSDFSVAAPYAEWLALVAIALHVPGRLEWNPNDLRFTNSPEANRFVKPVFRKGAELKL